MGPRVPATAYLDHLDVLDWLTGSSIEHLACLFLGHSPRRSARAPSGQVDELHDVPADEVVPLGAPDRPGERALDLQQRRLAELLGSVPEEPVGVDGLDVL